VSSRIYDTVMTVSRQFGVFHTAYIVKLLCYSALENPHGRIAAVWISRL